jgi:hypothetical protein
MLHVGDVVKRVTHEYATKGYRYVTDLCIVG